MSDQAAADTLYDAPAPKREGFRNEVYSPWILRTESCSRSKKEGFSSVILNPADHEPYNRKNFPALVLVLLGVGAILMSFYKHK
jgi:hypothetical protein